MDIYIKYSNGSMVVHLKEFLADRNISRVKKLLKIIRGSFTPECENQIREYIKEWLGEYEQVQSVHEKYITGYEEKIKFCQKQIKNCTLNRDKFKRSTPKCKSPGWENYNSHVKQFREEQSSLEKSLRYHRSEYNQNVRTKTFYEKILEIIT